MYVCVHMYVSVCMWNNWQISVKQWRQRVKENVLLCVLPVWVFSVLCVRVCISFCECMRLLLCSSVYSSACFYVHVFFIYSPLFLRVFRMFFACYFCLYFCVFTSIWAYVSVCVCAYVLHLCLCLFLWRVFMYLFLYCVKSENL